MRALVRSAVRRAEAQLHTRDDAAGCLYVGFAALLLTLLLFTLQGWALWGSPAAAVRFRHEVLVGAQAGSGLLVGFYAAITGLGWRHYRAHAPLRVAPYLLVTLMLVTAVLYTLLYGLQDTPLGLMLLAAVALARAWFPLRVLGPGLVLGGVLLIAGEVLIQRGDVPYAPLLSQPVVTGGEVAAWWMAWFAAIYYLGSLFFAVLMLLMFDIMRRHHAQLEALACVDPLTGLPNRTAFQRRLEEECAKQHRTRRPACVLVCDVDHFKRVNDSHGHPAGDLVLVHLGELLRQSVAAPLEVAARYGGEEFVVLLPETALEAARSLAGHVRQRLQGHPFESQGQCFSVTVSIGVAEFRNGDGEAALRAADANLYQAKAAGRNCVVASVAR